ncbi:MAG: phage tail tape measure protein [Nitrospirae bacterium]|nr:phage tail tape measure protein [Nitrospirota bacterium]
MASTELKIVLGAEIAQFISGLKNAETSMTGFINKIKGFPIHAATLAVVAKEVVGKVGELITFTADYGDELLKASQKTGVAVEELSGLKYAAELSGVSFEQLTTNLGKLSKNLFDAASGTGDAKDAFKKLGVDVKDSNGNLRSSEDVLIDVAEKFSTMEDGTTKSALAMKIFGKSGADMIPLLNQGAAGIKEATEEAKAFGLVVGEDAAKEAEDFNDNLDRMKGLVKGVATAIGNNLIPAINDLIEAWIEYSKKVNKTPSIWEEMWKKASPSAEINEKLKGIGFMQGGEFWIGEGVGGTIPPSQSNAKWSSGGKDKKKKTSPPVIDDEEKKKIDKAKKEYEDFMQAYQDDFSAAFNKMDREYEDFMQAYQDDFSAAFNKMDREYEDFMQAYRDSFSEEMLPTTKTFSEGWHEAIKKYVEDTGSMFNLATDMARQTAQAMQSAFQNFFFDMFQGKITSMKDLLRGLLTFAQQVASNILASMATTKIMSWVGSAATSIPAGAIGSAAGGGFVMEKTARLSSETEKVTVNIVNSGNTERPDVSYRRSDIEGLVLDIIYRDYNRNGMMRNLGTT